MLNVFMGNESIDISDLQVGFNGSEMYDLDGIVQFEGSKAHLRNVNLRADLYVLPFLNVYGIAGRTWTAPIYTLSNRSIFPRQRNSTEACSASGRHWPAG